MPRSVEAPTRPPKIYEEMSKSQQDLILAIVDKYHEHIQDKIKDVPLERFENTFIRLMDDGYLKLKLKKSKKSKGTICAEIFAWHDGGYWKLSGCEGTRR